MDTKDKALRAVPPPPRSPCRTRLAEAIGARARALEREREKLANLASVAEIVKTTDERRRLAESAVAETKTAAADRMVAAARGGVIPQPDQALVQARIEAVAAADEYQAASIAFERVKAEMEAATAEREAAEADVERSADDAVTEEGQKLMAEFVERARGLERKLVWLRLAVRWLVGARERVYGFNPQLSDIVDGDAAAVRFLADRDARIPGVPPIFGVSASNEVVDWSRHELNATWREWRQKLSTLPDALPPAVQGE
ncbi:MAG TPA: hypothetical protein VN668_07965 [Stellaceae bacterium]|nr:hypothetical protein [Stellaceae bacterium]